MVSDSGGFDDKSLQPDRLQGPHRRGEATWASRTRQVESKSDSDYANEHRRDGPAELQRHRLRRASSSRDATLAAAKKNPDVDFAIVDYTDLRRPAQEPTRARCLQHRPVELPRRLPRRGMTKTGKVGTFGGLNIPTVTIFMDGFWEGVQYYNKQKGTNVQVLGWDEQTQKGLFTNDFEDKTKGQTTAQNLISQGADIIFPVAGPAGLGALAGGQGLRRQGQRDLGRHRRLRLAPRSTATCLLTRVNKGMDVAVEDAISDVGRRQVRQHAVRRHAGERRRRPGAVPRLGQQDSRPSSSPRSTSSSRTSSTARSRSSRRPSRPP